MFSNQILKKTEPLLLKRVKVIMDIKNLKEAKHTTLCLSGELDAVSSIDLDEQIKQTLNSGEVNVLIDLKDLVYISSAGLGVFMSYVKDIESSNKQMILFNLNETIYSTFEILGLHHIITILDTKEEAIGKC